MAHELTDASIHKSAHHSCYRVAWGCLGLLVSDHLGATKGSWSMSCGSQVLTSPDPEAKKKKLSAELAQFSAE